MHTAGGGNWESRGCVTFVYGNVKLFLPADTGWGGGREGGGHPGYSFANRASISTSALWTMTSAPNTADPPVAVFGGICL